MEIPILFKFKFNGDKDKTLRQIKERGYFEEYQGTEKDIYLFGIEFADRNISEWILERPGTKSVPLRELR